MKKLNFLVLIFLLVGCAEIKLSNSNFITKSNKKTISFIRIVAGDSLHVRSIEVEHSYLVSNLSLKSFDIKSSSLTFLNLENNDSNQLPEIFERNKYFLFLFGINGGKKCCENVYIISFNEKNQPVIHYENNCEVCRHPSM
jgi:hypothetical protein